MKVFMVLVLALATIAIADLFQGDADVLELICLENIPAPWPHNCSDPALYGCSWQGVKCGEIGTLTRVTELF